MKNVFYITLCILFLFSCKDKEEEDNNNNNTPAANFQDDACQVCGQNAFQVFGSDTVRIFYVVTPNSDGQNDRFSIYLIDNYPNNSLIIYNRNNVQLASYAPYSNDWPASVGLVSNGLYKFKLTINSVTKEGSMLVLKQMDSYYNVKLTTSPCGSTCSIQDVNDPFLN